MEGMGIVDQHYRMSSKAYKLLKLSEDDSAEMKDKTIL